MANRRMFSKRLISDDKFSELTTGARALYFELGMFADDDGFISPRGIMKMYSHSDDDLRNLVGKGFVLEFPSGVVVVTDWKENNLIKTDRYNPTKYSSEMEMLSLEKGDRYSITDWNPSGTHLEPQVRLGKVRLGKVTSSSEKENLPESDIQCIINYWNMRNPSQMIRGNGPTGLRQNIAYQLTNFSLDEILLAIRKKPKSPKDFYRDIGFVTMMRRYTRTREEANYILSILQTPTEPLMLEAMQEEISNFLAQYHVEENV